MANKRLILLFGYLTLVFSSILCISSCTKNVDKLVYYPNKLPNDLRPIMTMNEEAKYLSELLFDGMVNKTTVKDGREEYQWALVAKDGYREEDLESHFVIILYLKKGVLWHDGRELIADDVIYTWQAIHASHSPISGWLDTFIESIENVKMNNYKIRVKLKVDRSMEAFMELFSPLKIIPRWYTLNGESREMPYNLNDGSEVSEAFKFRPIGTGPYKVKERKIAERINLTANLNDDYTYYLGKPGIESIGMELEKDPIKAVKELNKGMTLLFDVKQEYYTGLQDVSLNFTSYLPYSFYAIVYNTSKAPFQNIAFRKAATCAVNKIDLAKQFIFSSEAGSARAVNTGIFPSSSGYVQFMPEGFKDSNAFNPDRASGILRNAGSVPKMFRLMVCSQYDGIRIKELAETYANMMKAVGLDVAVDDYGAPLFDKKLEDRDFDAAVVQFTGFDHFYDVRTLFGNEEKNYWSVHDAELESLLKTMGSTIDWEKLVDVSQKIHARVNELAPGCFLFTLPRRAYYSNRLANVTVHPEVGFSTVESWQLN
jgi:peptide/nickel transport system substrate-binding protein